MTLEILEFIQNYNVPIVVITCLCIGYVLKHGVKTDKINRFIPLIMLVVGVLMNCWVAMDITPTIVVSGMVSGLASTGLHQAFTQLIDSGAGKALV